MVSKEQNYESEWRLMQCQGSAEQVNQTKAKIDQLLKDAGKQVGDASAMGLECHIIGSAPIQQGVSLQASL